ncbi:PH domain-containing protein [Deinococcus multiflagellatus]|uniref:PH domain-containing protein n=1 Tax=Deinococcus multiflagellatus TaxID=1656887 RepID=UPI001CCBC183|nr:PH domain-containing protein [Deinococcus multiflagellatus]MBZ9713217.1 PH domain-containing protein [Deinococcus multiflagellatus]
MSPVPVAVQTETVPRWWPWVRLALVLPLLFLPALTVGPVLLGLPVYRVQGGQITARSLGAHTVIPAGTPVERRPVGLRGKEVGSVLPGYTVGLFRTDLGRAQVFSDSSQDVAALVFATRPPTVLTPADPDALLRAWRAGETATFRPAQPARPGWELLLLVPLLPLVAFLFSRPRVRYLLDGDALVVRTAGTTTRFPRAGTRATLTTVPLGLRLFGTALPGYYSGTFSTGAVPGGRVQAAAGSSRPAQALLLEAGGPTFYLTPQDPETLAAWFTPAP